MLETILSHIDPTTVIGKLLLLGVVAILTSIIQRMVVRIARRTLEAAEVPQASIFINVLRALLWSFALLFVLQPVFGVEPTAFVAAIGVTSVALSLGLQDTISNLIGGLSLMLTRVIVPGDVVTVGSFTGTVTDINWRSTCLRARGGNVEVIPNSVLSKSSFTKLTPGAAAVNSYTLVMRHDADPAQVEAELLEVANRELGDLMSPDFKPSVQFGAMDAYGITVTLVTFMVPETFGATLNDRVSRAIAGREWLAKIC